MQALPETLNILARGEAPSGAIWAMAIGFAAVCIIMMLVVLIQKPKGGGLSGAFGGGAGGGGADNFIGGGVGNVLTGVTVACFLVFLLLACGMTLAINAGDDVPEDETEQTETDAGLTAPDGDTTPTVEVEPATEPAEDEGDDAEAVEPDATDADGEAETTEPATE